MKMSELKNGMIVTIKEGVRYIVARNIPDKEYEDITNDFLIDVDENSRRLLFIDDYKDDMTLREDVGMLDPDEFHYYDIIEVEKNGQIIWQRK